MNNENKNDKKGSNSKETDKSNKPRLSLEKRNEYLQGIIELSRKDNITVLSKEYLNNMSPLELECVVCNNKWTDFRANIMQKVKRNTFKCPYCSKKAKIVLFEYFKNLAIERGGKLLSPEFLGTSKPHLWYCNKHNSSWKAKPNNIKDHPSKKGTWCPKCSIESNPQNNYRYAIEDMQRIAESKAGGGRCLSPNFLGVTKRHIWKCGTCGHVWKAKPCDVVGKPQRPEGSWCPNCASGRSERICKNFFQELFGKEFRKENKLPWLKKYGLHLDGYNEELKLAFESQGIQHYIYHPYFHRDNPKLFEKQKRIDEYKRKECERHGIVLIEVGYEWRNGNLRKIKIKEMENYIRKNCTANGIYPPPKEKKIDWRKFDVSLPNYVKELREIAKQRDGKLLSKNYFEEVMPLEWYCNKHDFIWKATPSDIRGKPSRPDGTWCPKCSQERHKNKMKQITGNYLRDSEGRFKKIE